MGTKRDPGQFDCFTKAHPDEPMFVLLARDPAAPAAIYEWIRLRRLMIETGKKPSTDWPVLDEAMQCANQMREWYNQNRENTHG